MPISLTVKHPNHNLIEIDSWLFEHGNGRIIVEGIGNRLRIGAPQACGAIHFQMSGGAEIDVGPDCVLGSLKIYTLTAGAAVTIGAGCGFNGAPMLSVHEPARITLGIDCLIAGEVTLMASDVHRIFSLDTGERLNPPGDITLGERVWVATGAAILKGSVIGSGSVVALGAVVSGVFPANSLLAGVPARVVRERIRWEL